MQDLNIINRTSGRKHPVNPHSRGKRTDQRSNPPSNTVNRRAGDLNTPRDSPLRLTPHAPLNHGLTARVLTKVSISPKVHPRDVCQARCFHWKAGSQRSSGSSQILRHLGGNRYCSAGFGKFQISGLSEQHKLPHPRALSQESENPKSFYIPPPGQSLSC